MADDTSSLMAEFEQFLAAKQAKADEDAQQEDYEVEVWNEKGQGARLRRSHAKPFLQSLGIDVDPPANGDTNPDQSGDGSTGDKSKGGRKSTGSQSNATGTQSVARKYFVRSTPPTGK